MITNVTGAHVGEFGGMGQIAQAKGEILAGLPADGVAVLNRDDAYFTIWERLAAPREVRDFGLDPRARVTARALVCDDLGRYAFTLVADGVELGRVQLGLLNPAINGIPITTKRITIIDRVTLTAAFIMPFQLCPK